jgi:hypothetical protein
MKTRREIEQEALIALENIENLLAAGEITKEIAEMRRLAIVMLLSKI